MMLFKVENCFPSQYTDDLNKQLALDHLIVSSGQRKNIVILDRSIIEEILTCDLYRPPTKKYTIDIDTYRREYGAITKKLSVYTIVDFDFEGINCTLENNQWLIRISYNYFTNAVNSESIGLLTENELDFKFYSKIAEYYSRYISTFNIKVSFNFHFGGGSQSKAMFDRLTREGKILLCIIDSDKSHPEKSEGSTSSVFTVEDRSYNNRSLVHVINVREIETLLPLKNIEEILSIQGVADEIEAFDEIKAFSLVNTDFRKFFDHKEGLSLKEAIELDTKYGNFWLDTLSSNKRFSSMSCLQNKICYECESCPKVSGFGDKILKKVVDQLENLHLRNLEVDASLLPNWESIGELMMSWGCTPNIPISRSS